MSKNVVNGVSKFRVFFFNGVLILWCSNVIRLLISSLVMILLR